MRALLQRVAEATVCTEGNQLASIKGGLVVFVCVMADDTQEDVTKLANKTAALRIFNDAIGKLNLSLRQVEGECLVVSQFTLAANTAAGNRPEFTQAAKPALAKKLLAAYCTALEELSITVHTGIFGANMQVALTNDGPVTIWLDTKA